MICGHAPWTTRSLATGLILLRWHHSRPITMTSTTSPLCSSTYCSVFGGSIRSPLAVRMLMSLLLTWFPATPKRGAGIQSPRGFSFRVHLEHDLYTWLMPLSGILIVGFAGIAPIMLFTSRQWYSYQKRETQHIWINFTSLWLLVHISTLVTSHLCSVPMVEAPGDAMSECSGDIQGEGPASRRKTTRKNHNQMRFWRSSII